VIRGACARLDLIGEGAGRAGGSPTRPRDARQLRACAITLRKVQSERLSTHCSRLCPMLMVSSSTPTQASREGQERGRR
jgi:hypothetical protein